MTPHNSVEWDEAKRLKAIRKHGIDFAEAIKVFEGPHALLPARRDTEARFMAVGPLNGMVVAVIFTIRPDALRIITVRRARPDERRQYQALHA